MNERLPELISILVVEDDPGDYGLLRATLRQAGLMSIGPTNATPPVGAEQVTGMSCTKQRS